MERDEAPAPRDDGDRSVLRLVLTVWPSDDAGGWHALAEFPDASRIEFNSPFELARFLSWPPHAPRGRPGEGLR
jgi:hypothetical protein